MNASAHAFMGARSQQNDSHEPIPCKIDPESMPAASRTRYFAWEGDACRMREQENGDVTADIYRAGKGFLPVSLVYCAVEIGSARYQER
jgi:hypothetical protein